MSERITQLTVHSNSQRIGLTGIAHVGGNERWSFIYDGKEGDEVALNMDRSISAYEWQGIFPAFEQHLPEMDLGLFPQAIWKQIYRDSAGMLWVSGQRKLGRLRFSRPGEELPERAGVRLTREQILKTADGDELLAEILSHLTYLPGVSGVQPKVLVPVLGNDGAAPKAMADTHVLKGNRADMPYATVVEAASMELARRCGIEVPETDLSQDGRLLAIARFDLRPDGLPRGFDEAAALRGKWARDKYEGSYEAMHKALAGFIPSQRRLQFTEQVFKLLAFNYIIENGDAHLKNFGLLYDHPDDARLAPAYDLLTTTCFPGFARDTPALTLGGKKTWDVWKFFTQEATNRGLTHKQVQGLLKQLAEVVRPNLYLPVQFADQVPASGDLLMRAGESWARGLQRLEEYLRATHKPKPPARRSRSRLG